MKMADSATAKSKQLTINFNFYFSPQRKEGRLNGEVVKRESNILLIDGPNNSADVIALAEFFSV